MDGIPDLSDRSKTAPKPVGSSSVQEGLVRSRCHEDNRYQAQEYRNVRITAERIYAFYGRGWQMRRLVPVILVLIGLAMAAPHAGAQDRHAETLPLSRIIDIVASRYVGKVIDADVTGVRRREIEDRRSGVVYEVRLLTDKGHIIRIRIDAYTGAFLEVDGHGFLDALRNGTKP
jgi:uncharacterized membrane protein YkoI